MRSNPSRSVVLILPDSLQSMEITLVQPELCLNFLGSHSAISDRWKLAVARMHHRFAHDSNFKQSR